MVANVHLSTPVAAEAYHAERQWVSLGWYRPIEFHNSATKHGLAADKLSSEPIGIAALYIFRSAEQNTHPSVAGCIAWAEEVDVGTVNRVWLTQLLARGQWALLRCSLDKKKFGTTTAERLDECAQAVAHWAKAREELE